MYQLNGLTSGYVLMLILKRYARDTTQRQMCVNMYRTAKEQCMGEREIDLMFAQALADGLLHGNWPWVTV